MFLGSEVAVPFTGWHSVGKALLCGKRQKAPEAAPKTMWEWGKLARNNMAGVKAGVS